MKKKKILTLIENYEIFEDNYNNLIESVEYEIKEKEKRPLNKIVYLKNKNKYFKIMPYYYWEHTSDRSACDICELCKNVEIQCSCLKINNNIISSNLINGEHGFYFKEMDYYKILFGEYKDEDYKNKKE